MASVHDISSARRTWPKSYSSVNQLDEAELPWTDAKAKAFIPVWLRRSVLLAFVAFFTAVMTALELVLRLSHSQNGLTTVTESHHYLWVYGSTAIFTIVLALWSRVDYRLRQMTPWRHIDESNQKSLHSNLWKDYITPSMPEILWHSLCQRDYPVAAGTMVINLLTLLMVVSTALLLSEPRPLAIDESTYRLTSQFDVRELKDLRTSSLVLDIMDAMELEHMNQPAGTTPIYAYDTFSTNDAVDTSASTVSVVVDAITSDLKCTPVELENPVWDASYCYQPYSGADWIPAGSVRESPNITVRNSKYTYTPRMPESYDDQGQPRHFALFAPYVHDYIGRAPLWETDRELTTPILIAIGETRQSGVLGPSSSNDSCQGEIRPTVRIQVVQSQQWICEPEVSLVAVSVTCNTSVMTSGTLPVVQSAMGKTVRHPIGLNASNYVFIDNGKTNSTWYLGTIFKSIEDSDFAAEDTSSTSTTSLAARYSGHEVWSHRSNFLPRILRPAAATSSLDELLSTDLLVDLTRNYARAVMALTAHYGYRNRSGGSIQGTLTVNEDRLVVQSLPTYLMQALSGCIILLLLYVVLSQPARSTFSDPALLAGNLAVLYRFGSLQRHLSQLGALPLSATRQAYTHRYEHDPTELCPHPDASAPNERLLQIEGSTPITVDHQDPKWWHPLPTTRRVRASIGILLCLLVVGSETMLWYSQNSQGIADVSNGGSMPLAWSIIPALVLVSIAVYVRALGGSLKTLAPYVRLHESAPALALFRNYSSATEVEAIYRAANDRQWTTAIVSLSVLLSALLTIIVSGLWNIGNVSVQASISVRPLTWFTGTTADNGTVGSNAWLSSLILNANLPYPKWTKGNLAFPSYQIDAGTIQGKLRVTLPALRSTLNCNLYTGSGFPAYWCSYNTHTTSYDGRVKDNYAICLGSGKCATVWSPPIDMLSGSDKANIAMFYENTVDDCPLINFYWGWEDDEDIRYPTNFTDQPISYARVLSCTDSAEIVETETTFILPGFEIDDSEPPKVVSEPRVFSTARLPTTYDQFPRITNGSITGSGIWATLASRYGITTADLGNSGGDNKIVEALKEAHGIVRAQQYNAALRVNISDAADLIVPKDFPATLTQSNRWRLIQNNTSTHILCGVLLAMLLCLILASWLSSTRFILPKNPGSIGAQLSLLADSDILKDEALMMKLERALGDRRFMKDLSEERFHMGWFESKGEDIGSGDGDGDGKRLWTMNVVGKKNEVDEES